MKKLCNYRPIVFVFIFLMVAIAIVLWSYANLIVFSIFTTMGIVVFFFLLFFKNKYKKYLVIPIFFVIGLVSSFLTLQIFNTQKINYQNCSIQAQVIEIYDNYIYLDNIKVANSNINGKAIAFLNGDKNLEKGDVIKYYSNIKSIDLDYKDSYSISNFNDNILYLSKIKNFKKIGKVKLKLNQKIKQNTYLNLSNNLRSDSASICYGLLFGNSKYMSKEIKNAFSVSGLAHIFAVSGLHIGVLSSFLYFVAKKIKAKNWVNFLNIAIILILYNLLCGYSPSMIRATIMVLVYLVALMFGYKKDDLSTLSLSGIIILIFSPLSLFDLSFLMSYMAVLGIIIFKPKLNSFFKFLPKKLNDIISISISCNLLLFPIICTYFNSFPILFLVSNVLVMPIISFIYILLLLFTILSLLFPIAIILKAFDYLLIPIKALTLIIDNYVLSSVKIYWLPSFSVAYYGINFLNTRFIFIKKSIKLIVSIILVLISILIFII